MTQKHTPGPWEHVPATEHHGHYICAPWGSTICDLYCMSDPSLPSTLNGGSSRPIPFIEDDAEANARLIAAAPGMLALLIRYRNETPLGHQPHMIAGEADDVIRKATEPTP